MARLILISISSGRQQKYMQMDHLDSALAGLALQAKIPLEGLETISDRNKIHEEWLVSPTSSQEMNSVGIKDILETYGLDFFRKSLVMLYSLVEAYKQGDEEAIQKSTLNYFELMEPYPPEVLIKRNQLWGETVQEKKSLNNSFIAVGLTHLLGPNNFLDILKSQGWDYQRMASCD